MHPRRPQQSVAVSLPAIPTELCERAQWVGWRYVTRAGRQTKIPWRCDGRGAAAVDDPATWSPFQAASAALDRGVVDGLGFVFAPVDPFAGVDLDNCVGAGGELHGAAAQIVERLDSYAELSPSGRGVHVIVEACLGAGRRTSATSWSGTFEVYDRRRFFAMTGARLPDASATIERRQAELDAITAELLPPRRPVVVPPERPQVPLDVDRELLERARRARNGRSFALLYDDGDWAAAGHASSSEGDLALCARLSFWAGGDAQRVDRLFRASALFRAKWDAPRGDSTYGARTVARALATCSAFYVSREDRARDRAARIDAVLSARTPEELDAAARMVS